MAPWTYSYNPWDCLGFPDAYEVQPSDAERQYHKMRLFHHSEAPPWRPGPNQYTQPYNYQEAADALRFFQNATKADLNQARARFATVTRKYTVDGLEEVYTFPRAWYPERRVTGGWGAVIEGASDRSVADAGAKARYIPEGWGFIDRIMCWLGIYSDKMVQS
ncbi:hypothetical protein DL769_010897 [Monosporascus sp. CRB-8-3]|nr:hypothetical protein DL769_010897 [Monosporascus sp. CRB-8-3]